jgi:hypothetical protein
MLQYMLTAQNYPGDSFVRVSTQQHSDRQSNDSTFESKKKRKNKPDKISIASVITVNHLKNYEGRLCGFLDKLCDHIKAKTTFKGHNTQCCVVCRHSTHEKCSICGVPLHYTNTTNDWKVPCFFQYHNTSFFGLCKDDWRITPFKKGKFTIPADDTIARHAECMKELHAEAVNKPNNTPNKPNNTPSEVTDSNSSNIDVTPNESTTPDENEGINMDHVI